MFFRDLEIPTPDVNLGVGSGTHGEQTAAAMVGLEREWTADPPALVVVYGDVNSTLAASLVAAKLGVPTAHVEAGLRSFDRSMPEEINRIVSDLLADLHFTTSPEAEGLLRASGVPADRIRFVGNPMIDTLLAQRARFDPDGRARAARAARDVRGRDAPPAVERRRRGERPGRGGRPGRAVGAPAARDPAASAWPGDAGGGGPARRRSTPDRRAARVRGVPVARRRRAAGPHRLRRHPGGDDDPRRPVPDDAAEHGTADHGQPRHEPAGRAGRGRARPRARSSPARCGPPGRGRRCGTGTPGDRIADEIVDWLAPFAPAGSAA